MGGNGGKGERRDVLKDEVFLGGLAKFRFELFFGLHIPLFAHFHPPFAFRNLIPSKPHFPPVNTVHHAPICFSLAPALGSVNLLIFFFLI